MHDRKTLIYAIELRERIAKRNHQGFVDFPYEMVGKVLNLLKEQPEIVRCKDCWKRGSYYDCMCYGSGMDKNDDWFCADGEQKPTQANAKNNALDVR